MGTKNLKFRVGTKKSNRKIFTPLLSNTDFKIPCACCISFAFCNDGFEFKFEVEFDNAEGEGEGEEERSEEKNEVVEEGEGETGEELKKDEGERIDEGAEEWSEGGGGGGVTSGRHSRIVPRTIGEYCENGGIFLKFCKVSFMIRAAGGYS